MAAGWLRAPAWRSPRQGDSNHARRSHDVQGIRAGAQQGTPRTDFRPTGVSQAMIAEAPRWLRANSSRATASLTCVCLACSGFQSALDPKGPKAEAISHLNWFFVNVATIVYVVVIGALIFALRRATTRRVAFMETDADEPERERKRIRWVAGAAAATALVLLLFIFVDVSTARSLSQVGGARPLRIDVVGHQWWWEIRYTDVADPQNIVETA